MAKMEGLAHIGVFITDLARSKKFYEEVQMCIRDS